MGLFKKKTKIETLADFDAESSKIAGIQIANTMIAMNERNGQYKAKIEQLEEQVKQLTIKLDFVQKTAIKLAENCTEMINQIKN